MAKENDNGLNYIIQAIDNIITPRVETLKYDKTYRAKVTTVVDTGIYKVEISGVEYQLNYDGTLSVGDIVRVKAPLNNFSDIYIETEPSSGGSGGGTTNYKDLTNKPVLNTSTTASLETNSSEIINGTISLHKVSKTGSYNDLNDLPSLDFIASSQKGAASGVATLDENKIVPKSELPTDTAYDSNYTHITVVDNVTTESSTDALSANQGKLLSDRISANDTMIDTLQQDIIQTDDDLTAVKNDYISKTEKAAANGVATLDSNTKIYPVQLPVATADTLGAVKVGDNLSMTTDGVLSVTGVATLTDNKINSANLPIASADILGAIRVGENLTIDEDGILSSTASALQVASSTVLGGIKVGENLTITEDGVLSATGGSSGLVADTLPIGSVVEWYSSNIPTNWLECNGQAISRTDYSELFTVLGTTYGEGDGSTTFNLPNMSGKFNVGLDSDDTDFDTLGKTGGSKSQDMTHSHTTQSHILTVSELPAHTHTYDKSNSSTGSHTLTVSEIPSHTHTYNKSNSTTGSHTLTVSEIPSHNHQLYATSRQVGVDSGTNWVMKYIDDTKGYDNTTSTGGGQGHTHTISTTSTTTGSRGGGTGHTHTISTTSTNSGSTGGGEAHSHGDTGETELTVSTLPPYIVTYYIIKAKQAQVVEANVVDTLDSDSATDALSANQGKVLNEKILNIDKLQISSTEPTDSSVVLWIDTSET